MNDQEIKKEKIMEEQVQVEKKKSGLAIASLILAILLIIPFASLAALIMGIVALIKISNNKDKLTGQGQAIAGIIMGSIGCLFWFMIPLLATIAIPNYINFQLRAKTAEAKSNLGVIRTCEEAYKAENGRYISCGINPVNIPASGKELWSAGNPGWSEVGFEPKGDVYYQYTVSASEGGDEFTASAVGDLDGDGVTSLYTLDQDGNLTSDNPLE